MKKTALCLLVGILFIVEGISLPAFAIETYKVDPVHSTIMFRIKHLGITYVYGHFNEFEGMLTIDEKNPANSAVAAAIKTASIDTSNAKRDTHLRSPDFFDVKKYPTISFTSHGFKKVGEDLYEVTGELFLHGVRRPLTVELEKTGAGQDPWGGYRMGFETRFKINRSDFGMEHSLGPIGDTVRIDVSLEGVKK